MIEVKTNKLRLDNVLAADWYLQKYVVVSSNDSSSSSNSFNLGDSSYKASDVSGSSYEHSLV